MYTLNFMAIFLKVAQISIWTKVEYDFVVSQYNSNHCTKVPSLISAQKTVYKTVTLKWHAWSLRNDFSFQCIQPVLVPLTIFSDRQMGIWVSILLPHFTTSFHKFRQSSFENCSYNCVTCLSTGMASLGLIDLQNFCFASGRFCN